MSSDNGIVLRGHIKSERDFDVTVYLPNSGMLVDILKKDISTNQINIKEEKL
jgi:hypothetical protein